MNFLFGSKSEERPKVLQCRVGPTTKYLTVYNVNDENDPHFVESNLFVGYIVVRVKNFEGITRPEIGSDGEVVYQDAISSIPYFSDTRKRNFSIQVSGRFKQDFTADDLVFGAEFEHKDMFGDLPWLYSPLLCSMNTVNIKKILENTPENTVSTSSDINSDYTSCPSSQKFDYSTAILGKWEWIDKDLQENSALLSAALHQSEPSGKEAFSSEDIAGRRKYFQKKDNRTGTVFKEGLLYNFEIFAPFIDLNTFDLSLGINVNVHKYLNNQSQSRNEQLFVVEFDLVPDTSVPQASGDAKSKSKHKKK